MKIKKPYPRQLDRKTNKHVSKATKLLCTETGKELFKNEIITCVIIGKIYALI